MSKPKKYHIEGFEQFFNVLTEENFERLMTDFMMASSVYLGVVAEVRKKEPEETNGKTNWDITKYQFTWIDDGKNDMKSITVTNPKTGETFSKRF